MTIFDIQKDFQALIDLLDESGGEITEANADAMAAFEAEFSQNLAAKTDAYLMVLAKLESEKAVAQAQKDQFAKAEKVRANSITTLKGRLFYIMKATGQPKIVTPMMRQVSIVNNGGIQPMEIDPNFPAADIADEFKKTVTNVMLDTEKIRQALESGRELPFAKLKDRGQRLAIK